MDVSVEYVMWLEKERNKINNCDLYDLVLYEGNKRVEISKELLDSFAFTGLNNIDFITANYYNLPI